MTNSREHTSIQRTVGTWANEGMEEHCRPGRSEGSLLQRELQCILVCVCESPSLLAVYVCAYLHTHKRSPDMALSARMRAEESKICLHSTPPLKFTCVCRAGVCEGVCRSTSYSDGTVVCSMSFVGRLPPTDESSSSIVVGCAAEQKLYIEFHLLRDAG